MNFDAKTIAEQLAICEAATERPWTIDRLGIRAGARWVSAPEHHRTSGIELPNLTFIANARNHYPAALREIRVLERALENQAEGLPGTQRGWAAKWKERARKEVSE